MSSAGLRVARVARHYALRPSDMVGGGLSEYDAFCVDEALSYRLSALDHEAEEAELEDGEGRVEVVPPEEDLEHALARMESVPLRESKPPASARVLGVTEADVGA